MTASSVNASFDDLGEMAMQERGDISETPVTRPASAVRALDCRQARSLLALEVGLDLPDAETRHQLQAHLKLCPDCRCRQRQLHESQAVLVESRLTLDPRSRLWPRVASQLAEWEARPQFARFNAWVPTAIASVACLLLVSIATFEFQQGDNGRPANMAWSRSETRDLFQTAPEFRVTHGQFPSEADIRRWRAQRSLDGSHGAELQQARNPPQW